MLAIQSAMDTLRHAGPHGSSERHNLLREPSAEDLDAAHQLVSSARGERKNPPSVTESSVSESRDLGVCQPGASPVSTEAERAAGEPQPGEVAGSFSQACRYVPLPPKPSVAHCKMYTEG